MSKDNKVPPTGQTFTNVTMSVNADQAVKCWTQDQTLGKRPEFTPTVSVQGYAQFTTTGMMCGFNPTRKGAHGSLIIQRHHCQAVLVWNQPRHASMSVE